MFNRAIRRHHERRIRRRAIKLAKHSNTDPEDNKYITICAQNSNNFSFCSDYCCGNPRKHFGELTRQELAAEITEKEEKEWIEETLSKLELVSETHNKYLPS